MLVGLVRTAPSGRAPTIAPRRVFATMPLAIASSVSLELTVPSALAPTSVLDTESVPIGPVFAIAASWELIAH